MKLSLKTFHTLVASLLLTSASAVWAQDEEDPPATDSETVDEVADGSEAEELMGVFDEVVVIGNQETRLIDASVPITTISGDELQQQAPRNISDALTNIPSLQVENTSGNTNNEYRFRGVGAGGTQFLELEEDGIPIMRDAPDFLYRIHNGIDQIDTVRGGNSPILRTAAIGAVIDFRYREGSRDDHDGDFFFGVSDFGLRRVETWLGGPLTESTTYSLSAYYTTDDGVREVDYPANEGFNLHASLKYHFKDDSGYFKVSTRAFDEGNIVYLAVPLLGSVDNPRPFPGGPDITTGSLLSREIGLANTFSAPGVPSTLDLLDGNASKMSYIGTEFSRDWILNDSAVLGVIARNRYTDVDSRFSGFYAAGFALGGDFQTGESLVPNMLNSRTMGAGLVTYAYAMPSGFTPISYTVTNQQGNVLDGGTVADLNGNGVIDPGEAVSTATSLANGNGIFMPVAAFDQDNPFTSFQQDLEANLAWTSGDLQHYASVGYYYLNMNRSQFNRQQLFLIDLQPQANRVDVNLQGADGSEVTLTDDGFLTHNHWLNQDDISTEINAFYGTYEVSWDKLTVDVGLRVDEFSDLRLFAQTVNFFGDDPNQTPLPEPGTTVSPAVSAIQRVTGSFLTDFDFTNSETSYTLGANYLLRDTFGVYGRLTKGHLPNRNGATETDIVELGLRYDAGNFHVATNLFSLVQEGDVQERGLVVDGENVLVQFQTDRESVGLELEGAWQIAPRLSLNFSGTLQDPEFASGGTARATAGSSITQAELDAAVGDLTAIDGNQIANQPEVLGNLALVYSFDIGSLGTVIANAVARHVGEVPLDDGNNTFIGSYTQVNAGFNFESRHSDWYARLSFQNLTDEEAIQRVFGGPQSITDQLVAADGFYGRPLLGRNVIFGIGYRFQ